MLLRMYVFKSWFRITLANKHVNIPEPTFVLFIYFIRRHSCSILCINCSFVLWEIKLEEQDSLEIKKQEVVNKTLFIPASRGNPSVYVK